MNNRDVADSLRIINAAAQPALKDGLDANTFESKLLHLKDTVHAAWPAEGVLVEDWDKELDVMQESFRHWLEEVFEGVYCRKLSPELVQDELLDWLCNINKLVTGKRNKG